MLRCYYRLHTVSDYDSALRYASGFEGYLDNLRGICTNIADGNVSLTTFATDASGCSLVDQYYPPLSDESPVTNTVDLNKNIILSGPNKAGKTTILKTTALNIIFSQQIGCGFYSSALLCPYTHLHSYLNIPDTSGRDSLFQAESRRCKDILDHIKKGPAGSRHFCIFDELYSGTNPEEATKAGYAFLKYLSDYENVDFMLTTHYVKICKKFLKSDHVENFKMAVNVLENGEFDYTYQMKKGISKIQGAIRVMKDMEYPDEIIKGML
jgi:DNA mismatch repair ATPase MutS